MKKYIICFFVLLLFSTNSNAQNNIISNQIQNYRNMFENCSSTYQKDIENCPFDSFTQCNNYKQSISYKTQQCYKDIAINIFTKYYNLTTKTANQKVDDFTKYIYEQYLFITSEVEYCKQHNCGTSVYLYSEYATINALEDYVNRLIITLQTHFNTN